MGRIRSALEGVYVGVGTLLAAITFIGVWVAAVSSAGWVVGLALGWIPAYLAAVLALLLGPFALLLAVVALLATLR